MPALGLGLGLPLQIRGAKPFDADANAYIAAAGITDATQKTAANQLVLDLKGFGIWTKFSSGYLYPYLGGTQTSCSFNLSNPSQFQIDFNGTITFDSNGITPTAAGNSDTGLNINTIPANNLCFGVYLRTDSDDIGRDIYANDAGVTAAGIFPRLGNTTYFDNFEVGSRITGATANSLGLFTCSRVSSSNVRGYHNGTQTASGSNAQGLVLNGNILVTNSTFASTRNQAFAFAGPGLTPTEVSHLYTAIQVFETALGRQV